MNNQKIKYTAPEASIISFSDEDILTTSLGKNGTDTTEIDLNYGAE